LVCEPPSGSRFSLGITTVNCIAIDESGNRATCQFEVRVERPVGASGCEEFVQVDADPGHPGAFVEFPVPFVRDPCLAVPVVSVPPSGSFFPIGRTTVQHIAQLPWGDEVLCTTEVVVNGLDNIVWPRALPIPLTPNLEVLEGSFEQ